MARRRCQTQGIGARSGVYVFAFALAAAAAEARADVDWDSIDIMSRRRISSALSSLQISSQESRGGCIASPGPELRGEEGVRRIEASASLELELESEPEPGMQGVAGELARLKCMSAMCCSCTGVTLIGVCGFLSRVPSPELVWVMLTLAGARALMGGRTFSLLI